MKDIYLKFTKKTNSKDIPGESTDADHKDWVEVGFLMHDIAQPTSVTASSSGGHAIERCRHGEIGFQKDIDKSSVYLWEACSAAYAYDVEVQLFRASGTVRANYLTIKLTNAIISHVNTSCPQSGLPTETFGIKYAAITWLYKESKADGSANVANHFAGWDLSQNKIAV